MKIHEFSCIFMIFMNFHENRRKVENGPAAAHHAQRLLFPMAFYRFWRPSGPESGKSAKRVNSTHFHTFSLHFHLNSTSFPPRFHNVFTPIQHLFTSFSCHSRAHSASSAACKRLYIALYCCILLYTVSRRARALFRRPCPNPLFGWAARRPRGPSRDMEGR